MKYNNLAILLVLIFFGCSKDEKSPEVIKSNAKEIISFVIEGIETQIEGNTIKIYTPPTLSNYNFQPSITISEKAVISPTNSVFNFENEIVFKITAENGIVNSYSTQLIKIEGLQEVILSFKSDDDILYNGVDRIFGVIDEINKKIKIDYSGEIVKYWASRPSHHHPYLEIKTLGDVETSPSSNDYIDLSDKNQKLEIPSFNSTYELSIQNTDNLFFNINLPLIALGHSTNSSTSYAHQVYPEFTEGLSDNDILFFTLKNQDLSNLTPTFLEYSDYATITPDETMPQDFTKDVTYMITSETGVSNTQKVRVVEKSILFDRTRYPSSIPSSSGRVGTWYKATSKVTEVILVKVDNGETLNCEITDNHINADGDFYLTFDVEEMPLTETQCFIRCTLEEGITVDTDTEVTLMPS
ncbi:hypothetical protein H0I23_05835 [Cellulophaga sp. HaHaR_3_176]|uniref:DUF5018 domain-containing protein n=1 Tax=Cellulophaga sp. HaHaR_3_176 TaxID=1942464 RepID=UPI001C1FC3CE|nr:DUF5018 domain-containing protein [Cellulophaga sp. HaHaR_3_176]QWX85157.1 hypothetical protein H0I23_05835 [Cellulophaga sp. HaHaR_3_176]